MNLKLSADAQPMGEYHQFILNEINEIRKKTKPENWLNKGVIIFATEEISRLSNIEDMQSIVNTNFDDENIFYGRAYLPTNVGNFDRKASEIITRFYINGKLGPAVINFTGENMIDDTWSSWSYYFPEDAPQIFDCLNEGKHEIRVELWGTSIFEKTTTYVDGDHNKLGSVKEDINMGQFLGAGEFTYTKS